MKSPTVRLVLAAVLFAAWIGWLIYLAATATRPVVLSRPQFLVSALAAIASVTEVDGRPDPRVRVLEVYWTQAGQNPAEPEITIANLHDCEGWTGPGEYILPLVRDGKTYQVAALPRSPGFEPSRLSRPRIYRWTPHTRRQLEEIRSGE